MYSENSRRSACDRCRGQKLRCVRSLNGAHQNSLEPCERCIKAGADCIHTIHSHPWRNTSRSQHQQALIDAVHRANRDNAPHPESKDSHSKMVPQAVSMRRKSVSGRNYDDRVPLQRHVINLPSSTRLLSPKSHHEYRNSHSGGNYKSPLPPASSVASQETLLDFANFDFDVPLTSDESPCHDNVVTGLTDLFFSPVKNAPGGTCPSVSISNTLSPTLTTKSTLSTSSGREECLHRLSELSIQLLKEFDRGSDPGLGDLPALSFESKSMPSSLPDGGAAITTSLKELVGRVLKNSQTFLEALGHLGPDASPATMSSSISECSYSDHGDTTDLPHAADNSSTSIRFRVTGEEDTNALNPNETVELDMPTTLTILTCYTWLLRDYDKALSYIRTMLLSFRSRLVQDFQTAAPPLLQNLEIGCFTFDDHQDLQLEILLHVSSVMLRRIEDVLGISMGSSGQSRLFHHGRGILGRTSVSSSLLDAWFNNKDKKSPSSEN